MMFDGCNIKVELSHDFFCVFSKPYAKIRKTVTEVSNVNSLVKCVNTWMNKYIFFIVLIFNKWL